MAREMTDPMNSLTSFQQALATGGISPQSGEVHRELLVLMDQPQRGVNRLTYALVRNLRVVAIAIFVPADPMDGALCFNAGYAVDASHRSKGYGKEVVEKALDELTNGLQRAGVPKVYIEAIVSTSNEPSQRLASRLFSETPSHCTDGVSGQPALHYVRQLF